LPPPLIPTRKPHRVLDDLAALFASRLLQLRLGRVTRSLAACRQLTIVRATLLGLAGVAGPMNQRAAVRQHPLAANLAAVHYLTHSISP
jgi:hypothetical protein